MRIAVAINAFADLTPRQTTALLIEAFVALGHQVAVLQVADVRINTAGVPVAAVVSVRESDLAASTESWVASVRAAKPEPLDVSSCGLLLIRTNPGRDIERAWAHSTLLDWAWLVQHFGVPVINDPCGLAKTASKAYTFCLPGAIRPRGVIAAGLEEVRAFVRDVDAPCVIKPLVGSRGYNVFVIRDADDAELPRIVDAVTLRGFAIVQEFVQSEMPGDARVVLLDGKVLESDGVVAGIRRIPQGDDFRANLHAGAKAVSLDLTPPIRAAAERVGRLLLRDKIRLAGVDLIGDQVIEVNVYSTGGLFHAQKFGGVDFASIVAEQLVVSGGNNQKAKQASPA